jgi:LL-diaminopimelate aminotransferase
MTGVSRILERLPPYPFRELEEKASRAGGERRVLRFAIGDPDIPPPNALIDAAAAAMRLADGNRYSSSAGESVLREAVAAWMQRRFRVSVDPDREVCVLVGSKEGLSGLPRAILNPGDVVVVPDPGYPAYATAVHLGRFRLATLPLRPNAGWLPDWGLLPSNGRLLYLNYPNNPTGAVAGREELRTAVHLARDTGFRIAYDNAYSEITFAGERAASILEVPDARDVALEFHSLSKTLGIPGWRIGFAVGNAEMVRALVKLKSNSDSGAAMPLQHAAVAGLALYGDRGWSSDVRRSIAEYGRRLSTLAGGLRRLGWEVARPKGTLYLWHRAPGGDGGVFADRLLDKAGVLVTPGGAFGRLGREYVRWAATSGRSDIGEALERIGNLDLAA